MPAAMAAAPLGEDCLEAWVLLAVPAGLFSGGGGLPAIARASSVLARPLGAAAAAGRPFFSERNSCHTPGSLATARAGLARHWGGVPRLGMGSPSKDTPLPATAAAIGPVRTAPSCGLARPRAARPALFMGASVSLLCVGVRGSRRMGTLLGTSDFMCMRNARGGTRYGVAGMRWAGESKRRRIHSFAVAKGGSLHWQDIPPPTERHFPIALLVLARAAHPPALP